MIVYAAMTADAVDVAMAVGRAKVAMTVALTAASRGNDRGLDRVVARSTYKTSLTADKEVEGCFCFDLFLCLSVV